MAQSKIDNLQTYSDGRFDFQLPAGMSLIDENVSLNVIKLTLADLPKGQDITAQIAAMRDKALESPWVPILKLYHWSNDTGGILLGGIEGQPDFYTLEGRKIVGSHVLIASSGDDKNNLESLHKNIRAALAGFHPEESPHGKSGVFALYGGYTTQESGNDEVLFSSWINPDYDLSFDISSQVFLQPQKLDLIERSSRVSSVFSEIGGHSKVLRKDTRMLNGMMGQEYISADTDEHGVLRYSARLQVPGEAISPLKPQVEITLQTGMLDTNLPPPSHKLTQEQFLALWDALVTSFKARDLN